MCSGLAASTAHGGWIGSFLLLNLWAITSIFGALGVDAWNLRRPRMGAVRWALFAGFVIAYQTLWFFAAGLYGMAFVHP